MKVLHLEHMRAWSGQTGRVLDDIRELRAAGADVRILCAPASQLAQRAAAIGFEPVPVYLLYKPGPLRALRREIRRWRPDLVHAHGSRDQMCGILASAATGVPVIRTKHNVNRLKSGPFSRFMYGRLTTRLVAVSEAVKAALVEDGIRPDHIRVVRGGIDLERYVPGDPAVERAKLGVTGGGPVFAMIGRLAISKGSEVLFRAIPKVLERRPDARFFCVGSDQFWRGWLAEEAQAAIRPAVTITGHVDDVRPYIGAADAVLVPSLKEGLGSAILEAMAMARPTLGSRTGGIPELIVPGETGELYPPGDSDALAASIVEFAAKPERWPSYREKARARAAGFDVRGLGKAMLSVYEEVLRPSRLV